MTAPTMQVGSAVEFLFRGQERVGIATVLEIQDDSYIIVLDTVDNVIDGRYQVDKVLAVKASSLRTTDATGRANHAAALASFHSKLYYAYTLNTGETDSAMGHNE